MDPAGDVEKPRHPDPESMPEKGYLEHEPPKQGLDAETRLSSAEKGGSDAVRQAAAAARGTSSESARPSSGTIDVGDDDAPTAEELATLELVCDDVPFAIYLVAVAEVAERFAFRSLTGPLQNYIQNPLDDPHRPGALGKGQSVATGLGYFFQFWCYITPIFGAIVADSWLGRFRTILVCAMIATVGMCILFVTSLPSMLRRDAGLPGLIVSLIVIGLGSGGLKSNVGPLIADQYSGKKRRVVTLKTGKRVIVDPDVTIRTIFSRYYWVINVGSSSALIASWVELKVGFWAAYLISFCVYGATVIILLFASRAYTHRPPQGSIIPQAFHALLIGLKNRNMDKAKPSYLAQQGHADVPWSDHFIEELKTALVACRIFAVFPIFWLCMGQSSGNTVSLAALMNTYGLPNDFFGGFNPITVLLLLPLLDYVVYPLLRKLKINFYPVSRITFGFLCMAGSVAFAAGAQAMVEKRPHREVSVLWVLPIYILGAAGEVFAFLTSAEYAYTKAPSTMKSLVSSINLLTCAVGSAIGFALSPVSTYDTVLVLFAALSGIMGLTTVIFYAMFYKYSRQEAKMNELNRQEEE